MPKDPERAAALTVRLATEEPVEPLPARDPVTEYLATIGRQGGIKGGKARAQALSGKRRSEIARLAAQARWNRDGSSD
jgi:hypothetical protein